MTDDILGVLPTREELKPCPFCGGTDGDLVQGFTRATEDFAFWSVECVKCGAEIDSDTSQAEADEYWNTRHSPAPAKGGVPAGARLMSDFLDDFEASLPADLLEEGRQRLAQRLTSPATPAGYSEVQAGSYRDMHQIATEELGYPSILEALEAAPKAPQVRMRSSNGGDAWVYAGSVAAFEDDGWTAISDVVAPPAGDSDGLNLARHIVEADLHAAIEQGDADWEGMSRTALIAIDAAIAGPPSALANATPPEDDQ